MRGSLGGKYKNSYGEAVQVIATPIAWSRTTLASERDRSLRKERTESPDRKLLKRSLLAASISSALSCSVVARAQSVEEITVTGSRVRVTQGMAEPTPVTVVTLEQLQSLNAGATVVEQLAQLPQFFNTFSSQRGSGTLFAEAGGSYLNLRNLGRERTLILLDGSRLPPADKRGYVNVDILPTGLMQSVDVVTGGASAAYGADALGGVVNYRLNREFEGLNVRVGMGRTDWGDGDTYNVDVAGGTQIGEKLHIVGSFNTTEIEEINRLAADVRDRTDWYENFGHVTNPAWSPGAAVPQRLTLPCVSPTDRAPAGMLWSRVGDSIATTAPLTSFAYNGMVFTDDGQNVRPFVRAPYYSAPGGVGSTTTMGGDCNNPEFAEYMQSRNAVSGREVVSRSGFFGAQYQFTDRLTGFVQALAGRSESTFHDNLGGVVFTGGWHGKVFRENAFLANPVRQAMDAAGISLFQIWRSEAPFSDRNLNFGYEEYGKFLTSTYSAGVDYEFENGWALRGSWQTGHSDRETGIVDEQRVDRTYMALDAVVNASTGAIICNVNRFNPTPAQLAASPSVQGRLASPGGVPGGTAGATTTAPLASPVGLDGSIESCTPLNIMGLATNTYEARSYINTPKFGDGNVDQDFAEVLLNGDFLDGRRYGAIGFAAGLTYREQTFDDQALPTEIDVLGPPLNAPELGIRGIPSGYTAGSANLHARSTVPNVNGNYDVWEWFGEVNVPIWESESGARGLGGSLGVRQSDYSNLDDTLDSWKVGLELQVAEDLRLRFTRSGDIREATFAERFDTQSTGLNLIDPFLNNATYATTQTSGGNPDLAPERATTDVAGIVYQPRWAPNLSLSADAYDVQIRDSIGQLGPQRIVNECFAGNQALCQQLRLDGGQISRIFNVFLNIARARVKGVDYEIAYNIEPDFLSNKAETLSIRALAGHIKERSDTPFGATTPTHLEGSRELGFSTPKLQAVVTANYGFGPWSVQLTHRHIDEILLNRLWREGVDVDDNTISAADYTSARFGYTGDLDGGARSFKVFLDITNLLDKGPPLIAGGATGADQAVDAQYDIYGRRFNVTFSMDF
jgi:iron complex outermembrane recepter protein